MTAIFTPGSEGRSFQVSSEGSSMMCAPACCAIDRAPSNVHSPHARAKLVITCFIFLVLQCDWAFVVSAEYSTLRFTTASKSVAAAGPYMRQQRSATLVFCNWLSAALSDLAAHVLTDARREPIVEAGINT